MRVIWRKTPCFLHDPAGAAAAAVLGALACFFFAVAPAPAEQIPVEGQQVTGIRVVDRSGAEVTEKIPPLPLEVGKPFDFSDERESLRRLYKMGDYADIRVNAAPEAGGVRVDFVVRRNFFNNVIRVVGLKEPPTEPAALATLRLVLGEPFRESSVREAADRLESALHDDGLYQAKISWALAPHEDTRQMDVTILVDSGPRALVGDVAVDNQTPFTDAQLLHRAKLSGGKIGMTAARLSRGSERLRKFLVNQGYLGATALITPQTYDPSTNRVPLRMTVETGPRVRIEISGAHLSKGKQKKLLPVFAEGAVDEDLLQEGRRNLRDYLQSQGYFDADVQVSSQSTDKPVERVLHYDVSRGDQFRLAGIGFDGNKYFSNGLLSRRLLLQTASFASSGRFSQQLLRGDQDSIRGVYLSNGFSNCQVTSTVDDHFREKKNNLFVSFHIVEGAQTRIADLHIDGNHAISTDELLNVTGSTKGEPYSESGVASDRNNILALYYNEGFPEAGFREEVIPGANPNEVSLAYHVTEGRRIEVSKVLITGYQFTRPGIIRRRWRSKPAAPFAKGTWQKTQRQLYNLGVFNRVQIAPQNPDGTDPGQSSRDRDPGRATVHDRLRVWIRSAANRRRQHESQRHNDRRKPARNFRNCAQQHVRPGADAFVQGARQHSRIPRCARITPPTICLTTRI